MRIAIIGTEYVGLVSGACFADFGHHVTCIDNDADKIAAFNAGKYRFSSPTSSRLWHRMSNKGAFSSPPMSPTQWSADTVLIAVGTPTRRGDGYADLSYVYAAAGEIAAALDGFTVVVTKSTVPVGTGDEVERLIREARRMSMSQWYRTLNSCARAPQFGISNTPTVSSLAAMTNGRAR